MKLITSLLFMLFYAYTATAQINTVVHQNQILLNLVELSTEEIEVLLSEFEAEELWVSPISETRCWSFNSFPGVHEIEIDGETIYLYNILQAQELVKSRSSGGTSGVSVSTNPLPKYTIPNIGSTTGFFKPELFVENGSNEVLLSILDSGITKYVDDTDGYPYISEIENSTNYIDGELAFDGNGHGTHIAGIANHIATNNSPGSDVINIEVRKILNSDNQGDLGAYILSIEDAIVAGAKVLNLSLSFPEVEGNFFVNLLVGLLEDNNILGVVAAGNDGLDLTSAVIEPTTPTGINIYPAALQSPNLITVASVSNKSSKLSTFSNYGFQNVDVAINGELVAGYNTESDFIGMSGTSQATAIVSGIAANLGSHQATFDGASIKCAIVNSVDFKESLMGRIASEGTVNAEAALTWLHQNTNCQDSERLAPTTNSESGIYPNPFTKELNIQLQQGINVITVSDIFGKVIYTSTENSPNGGMLYQLSELERFPSGLYILNVRNKLSNVTQSTKVLKN